MTAEPLAIEVSGLVKHYENVRAVNGITFSVRAGEIFGFLGPNGAGKTTTINMLTGLARADEGTVRVGGIDCTRNPKAAQHLTGVVPDESNLYPELSGYDNLCFCGALYGMPKKEREQRARELLEQFGLTAAAGRKFSEYSKGMKRKLTLAAGIIHRPPILFLDEPTTGIDVASARQIRQMIADLNRVGTTVFLTTHYIEEAERVCGRIAFIVSGRIARIDTIDRLLQPLENKHSVEFSIEPAPAEVPAAIRSAFPGLEWENAGVGRLRVTSAQPVRIAPLVRAFEDAGLEVGEARKVRPSLEEVFVQITGIEVDLLKKEAEKTGANRE